MAQEGADGLRRSSAAQQMGGSRVTEHVGGREALAVDPGRFMARRTIALTAEADRQPCGARNRGNTVGQAVRGRARRM